LAFGDFDGEKNQPDTEGTWNRGERKATNVVVQLVSRGGRSKLCAVYHRKKFGMVGKKGQSVGGFFLLNDWRLREVAVNGMWFPSFYISYQGK